MTKLTKEENLKFEQWLAETPTWLKQARAKNEEHLEFLRKQYEAAHPESWHMLLFALDIFEMPPWLAQPIKCCIRRAYDTADNKRKRGDEWRDLLRMWKVQNLRHRGVRWKNVYAVASEELRGTEERGTPSAIKASYLRGKRIHADKRRSGLG